MQTDPKILELEGRIAKLSAELSDLSSAFYKNNFTSTQTFNKDCIFATRLRVPVYGAAPTVAEVGDLICVAAKLYICTSSSPVTFTLVGTQS